MNSAFEALPPSPAARPADLFWIAVSLGLLFGLLEGAEGALLNFAPTIRPQANVSADILWVAPPAYVAAYSLLAIALLPIVRRRRVSRAALSVPFLFLGFAALLRYPHLVTNYAWMSLALGLAMVTQRVLKRRETRLTHAYRRLALALGVGVLVIFLTLTFLRAREASFRPANFAPAARPSVLLIILDTARADSLSCYGATGPTPHLDRLAREGVLFERAYAASSWTLPSTASLLTGQPLSAHKVDWTAPYVPKRLPQLQEFLLEKGYVTGAFIANNIFFTAEHGFGRGFQVYENYDVFTLVSRMAFGDMLDRIRFRLGIEIRPYRSAAEINRRFLNWRNRNDTRPFFAVLNYMDAHEPYMRPTDPDSAISIWRKRFPDGWNAEEQAYLIRQNQAAIRYIDEQVGELVAELERRGEWDNTLLIITSDHGESFRYFDHGVDLRQESIQVPLIVRVPSSPLAGRRVKAPVSLMSLPSTVARLAGFEGSHPFPGHTLMDIQRSETPSALEEPILSELMSREGQIEAEAFVNYSWHYISYPLTKKEELFALPAAPDVHKNVAGEPTHQEALREMRQRAEKVRRRAQGPT